MKQHDIAVIAGDGIGPEVTVEALKVARAAADVFGFELRVNELPFSTNHYLKTKEIFPDEAFEEVRSMDAVFLGAIGDPRVPVGMMERGIIGKCRFDLDLYLNLRPIKLYDERLCPIKGKRPEDIDMLVVRENTEDAYAGMHGFAHKGQPLEVATQTSVYTREGVERAVRYAFGLAEQRPAKKVTLVDKANAMRAQDLWTRTFAEVAAEFPGIATEHAYIDAACMYMISQPEWFDVVVTPNLFGDIITDLGASLQGGMGIAASGNVHPGKVSLFEPIHGSAPQYAGKLSCSPVAAILAAGMLLDYVGEKDAGEAIENAIISLVQSGHLRGVQLGMHRGPDVGDMVVAELAKQAANV